MTFKAQLQAIIDDLTANLTAGVHLAENLEINADGIWQVPTGDQVVIDITGLNPKTDSGGTYWDVTLTLACISTSSMVAAAQLVADATVRMEANDFQASGRAAPIQPDTQYPHRGFEVAFTSTASFDTFA